MPDLNLYESVWQDLKKVVASRKTRNMSEVENIAYGKASDSSGTLSGVGDWLGITFAIEDSSKGELYLRVLKNLVMKGTNIL